MLETGGIMEMKWLEYPDVFLSVFSLPSTYL